MDYYTLRELAELLKISEATVRVMVKDGEIPFCKIKKRIYRFDKGQIAKWLKKREGGQ